MDNSTLRKLTRYLQDTLSPNNQKKIGGDLELYTKHGVKDTVEDTVEDESIVAVGIINRNAEALHRFEDFCVFHHCVQFFDEHSYRVSN